MLDGNKYKGENHRAEMLPENETLKLSKGSQAKPSPSRQILNKFLKDMREEVIMYLRRILNREGTGSAKVPREDLSGTFEEDEGGWYG